MSQTEQDLLEAVKESAIDCMLNQCENRNKCFRFIGNQEELAYLPNISEDILYGYKQARSKEVKKELVIAGLTDDQRVLSDIIQIHELVGLRSAHQSKI